MPWDNKVRAAVKRGRRRGAWWVCFWDTIKPLVRPGGWADLWTSVFHGADVHQITSHTWTDRYPDLFDLAAKLNPHALRILSFGCSTGEELLSLRRRFPDANIVGVEINPRSRRLARQRTASDRKTLVVKPGDVAGFFDVVFVLAVLQREPFMVGETEMADISGHYPFSKFDEAIRSLVDRLNPSGLLCVMNAHYRVEDSSAAVHLHPIAHSSPLGHPLFGPDGTLIGTAIGRSIFRRRGPLKVNLSHARADSAEQTVLQEPRALG